MSTLTRSLSEWGQYLEKMPDRGPCIRGNAFMSSGKETWKSLAPWVSLFEGDIVLDIGCGHGRMAMDLINTKVNYIGIDIIPEAIEWAKTAFSPWTNIWFRHIDIENKYYNPYGTIRPETFTTAASKDSIDVVLMLSVFTHMDSMAHVRSYFSEVRRILKKDGFFVCSWFTSPPNKSSRDAKRAAYSSDAINDLLRSFGFSCVGSFGGSTANWHDQKVMILKHASTFA